MTFFRFFLVIELTSKRFHLTFVSCLYFLQEFLIDISERSPGDHPNGIEYRLLGEACLPNVLSIPNGIPSIFEEHRIVKNLNVYRYNATDLSSGAGVYGEDENKFIFYNVIVGHKVKARFKITNPNKVRYSDTIRQGCISCTN